MGIVKDALAGLNDLPLWYRANARGRDPRLWTFGAWDGQRYSDNSRALYEYVLAHRQDIQAVWMTKSAEVYELLTSRHMPVAMCDSEEGRSVQQRAGYFFLTKGPQDSDPRLMHGCHLVWLWHGMPLKQIGRDAMAFQRRNTWWKRCKTMIRRIVVPWEFLGGETLSTAPFFTPYLQSAFGLTGRDVWEVGYPRNDHFFKADVRESLIQRLHEQYDRVEQGQVKPVRLLLYMPTHRDAVTRSGRAFDPFAEAGFDLQQLEEVLQQQNILLLYKGHFFDSANEGLRQSRRILTVTDADYDDMYTFIKDVDILLTDYSSIYFDFLLCRKPIILFPFDEAEYVAHSRPFYFDYQLMDGRKVCSWAELCESLSACDYYVPSDSTIDLMHTHQDGLTCQRIVQRVLYPSK